MTRLPAPSAVRTGAVTIGLALVTATALAGCGSAGASHGTAGSASATSSATAPASASTGTLSKTEFVTKMDAVCTAIDAKRKALPTPSGPSDFAALTAYTEGTLALFPAYFSQASALVAQSADKAELQAKWLDVEKSDFSAQQVAAEKLLTASKEKNAALVSQYTSQLSAASDHSSEIAAFMTTYGLTSCAALESS
jgi:glucose/arabinose dehydrogenase